MDCVLAPAGKRMLLERVLRCCPGASFTLSFWNRAQACKQDCGVQNTRDCFSHCLRARGHCISCHRVPGLQPHGSEVLDPGLRTPIDRAGTNPALKARPVLKCLGTGGLHHRGSAGLAPLSAAILVKTHRRQQRRACRCRRDPSHPGDRRKHGREQPAPSHPVTTFQWGGKVRLKHDIGAWPTYGQHLVALPRSSRGSRPQV